LNDFIAHTQKKVASNQQYSKFVNNLQAVLQSLSTSFYGSDSKLLPTVSAQSNSNSNEGLQHVQDRPNNNQGDNSNVVEVQNHVQEMKSQIDSEIEVVSESVSNSSVGTKSQATSSIQSESQFDMEISSVSARSNTVDTEVKQSVVLPASAKKAHVKKQFHKKH
jgi:hypothetical protein